MTHPYIFDKITGAGLEGKQTIPGRSVIGEINSDEERVASAAANANIERSNSQPANIIGVCQEDQEPIAITHIPPSLRYTHHLFQKNTKMLARSDTLFYHPHMTLIRRVRVMIRNLMHFHQGQENHQRESYKVRKEKITKRIQIILTLKNENYHP